MESDRITTLEGKLDELTKACTRSLEYCESVQRHTVDVLQKDNQRKDKLLADKLQAETIKIVADVCAKIEKRARRCPDKAISEYLEDMLEEIETPMIENAGVDIKKVEAGEKRPENVATVVGVEDTGDIELKNLVKECLTPYWILNGKVIRKSEVIMFKYDEELDESLKAAQEEEKEASTEGAAETPAAVPEKIEGAAETPAAEPKAGVDAERIPEEEPNRTAYVGQPEEVPQSAEGEARTPPEAPAEVKESGATTEASFEEPNEVKDDDTTSDKKHKHRSFFRRRR